MSIRIRVLCMRVYIAYTRVRVYHVLGDNGHDIRCVCSGVQCNDTAAGPPTLLFACLAKQRSVVEWVLEPSARRTPTWSCTYCDARMPLLWRRPTQGVCGPGLYVPSPPAPSRRRDFHISGTLTLVTQCEPFGGDARRVGERRRRQERRNAPPPSLIVSVPLVRRTRPTDLQSAKGHERAGSGMAAAPGP